MDITKLNSILESLQFESKLNTISPEDFKKFLHFLKNIQILNH